MAVFGDLNDFGNGWQVIVLKMCEHVRVELSHFKVLLQIYEQTGLLVMCGLWETYSKMQMYQNHCPMICAYNEVHDSVELELELD